MWMALFHPLCSSRTPVVGKDEAKLTSLIQSQQWPIGFGPSREIVAWDQGDEVWDGEDGDYPYPLGVFPPSMPLDWVLDIDVDEDPPLALLNVSEEDFIREVKVARPKTRGKRVLLNLVSSINYEKLVHPLGERNARLKCKSIECLFRA